MGRGCGLHYVRRGDGPPLLLIQGVSASHHHWGERLLAALARSFDVVAYDHRGVGDSMTVTGPFRISDLADDAERLLDEIGWDSTSVFGVSMGGLVAQELSLLRPNRVTSLVLGCTTTGGPQHRAKAAAGRRRLAGTVVQGNAAYTARNVFRLGVKDVDRLPPEAWLEYHHAAMATPPDPRTTVLQMHAMNRHSTADRLAQIGAPALVVHGDADEMVDVSEGAAVAQGIQNARFEVWSAGHFYWLEDPQRTAQSVSDFARVG